MRIWPYVVAGIVLSGCCFASEPPLPDNAKADRVVVVKSRRTLTLMSRGKVLKSYKVALGGDPIGPKIQQGDHKTPEGTYILDRRNAHSQF